MAYKELLLTSFNFLTVCLIGMLSTCDYCYAHWGQDADHNSTEIRNINKTDINFSLFGPPTSLSKRQLQLPSEWEGQCNGSVNLVTASNVTSQVALELKCNMMNSKSWRLDIYRKWVNRMASDLKSLMPMGEELRVAVNMTCLGGSASLPWPYRAPYLWYLKVRNCNVSDDMEEYSVEKYEEPDVIKGIDIADCHMLIRKKNLFYANDHAKDLRKQIICHPENIEAFTKRNVSVTITELDWEPKNDHMSPSDKIAKFNQDNNMNKQGCNYPHWTYLDQSHSTNIPKMYFDYLTRKSSFPALKYVNFSYSHITDMSVHVLGWRTYFPSIQYFDLSHNRITTFSGFTDSGLPNTENGTVDLSYNNFTSLTVLELKALEMHTKTVKLNLHNNPWTCDCDMKHFFIFLQNETLSKTVRTEVFDDLKTLTCTTPEALTDRPISELTINDLICTTEKTLFMVAPFVALGIVVLILCVVIFFLYRYRKHITILVYTRLYIVLPCQHLEKHLDKNYDAFVAYSSAEFDTKWVMETLAPRLEEAEFGLGFKLCLHHRDFAVGAAIAENISKSVEESRRTLIVLTKSFVESEWCVMEFRLAFHQSLLEKKKHMIIIILEEVPMEVLDADMRRCLQTLTFVKADDKYFWDKLIYALSEKTARINGRRRRQNVVGDEINDNDFQGNANDEHVVEVDNPAFVPVVYV